VCPESSNATIGYIDMSSIKSRAKKKQTRTNYYLNLSYEALKKKSFTDHKQMSDNDFSKIIHVTSNKFLLTDEWKKLRKKAVDLYGNKCKKCGFQGTVNHPIHIDHIKPRKMYPELALDITNLQPLCGRCNKEKGNKTDVNYKVKEVGLLNI